MSWSPGRGGYVVGVSVEPSASVPAKATTFDDRSPENMTRFYRFIQILSNGLGKVFVQFKAIGTENVPMEGGVLIISNHQSNLDPPLLGMGLKRPVAFLAKSQLFKYKAFAKFIRALNAFPVKLGAGDIGAMRESIRLLQAGWILNVFAEGSRTFDGDLQPAQKGAGLLIRKCGVPVVPAVIDGSFQSWPRGTKFPKMSKITVVYGPAVDLSHMKADEIRQWIDETLGQMLSDLRSGKTRP